MIQVAILTPQTEEEIIHNHRQEMLKTLYNLRGSSRLLRVESMAEEIFTEIKNKIEKQSLSGLWHTVYLKDRNKSELEEAMEIVKSLFIQAQHKARTSYFSDSWCRKSGKFGELYIELK